MEIKTDNQPNGYRIVLSHKRGKKVELIDIFVDDKDMEEEKLLSCIKSGFRCLQEKIAIK